MAGKTWCKAKKIGSKGDEDDGNILGGDEERTGSECDEDDGNDLGDVKKTSSGGNEDEKERKEEERRGGIRGEENWFKRSALGGEEKKTISEGSI